MFSIIAAPHTEAAKACSEYLQGKNCTPGEIAVIPLDADDNKENNLIQSVKDGKYRLLIADPYRFDQKWQLGDMNVLKDNTGSKWKTQIFLFLLEPQSMTSCQIDQSMRLFGRPDDKNFPSACFNKDAIAVTSTKYAIENEALRKCKKPDDLWEVKIISNNLHKAVQENDLKHVQRTLWLLPAQTNPSIIWQLAEDEYKLLEYYVNNEN